MTRRRTRFVGSRALGSGARKDIMTRVIRGTARRPKTSKLSKKKKPATRQLEKRARRQTRATGASTAVLDDDEEDADEQRGRFAPPPNGNSTPIVIALFAVVALVFGAFMFTGDGSSLVDEHEAEKAYNL